MTGKSNKITLFSLGVEELAMALGLINRADLGRELLLSLYDTLNEEQIDARLSSASHSLMARGLVAISRTGTPLLESRLEQALFPLAQFDYILQVSIVKEGAQTSSTMHIQRDKSFTSHSVQGGVVHVLEFGPYEMLTEYLQDVYDSIGGQGDFPVTTEWKITSGVLGKAINLGKKQQEINSLLKEYGLPESDAKSLAKDIANQKMRGTILQVKVDHSQPMDNITNAPKKMLLLLQGDKHSWTFNFSDTGDLTPGTTQIVDKLSFKNTLTSFIA